MPVKELIKNIGGAVAPGMLNRRFVRINTEKEPEIVLLPLMCNDDELAIDIGANQGLYVHHLLSIAKDVVAFEPLRAMQATLRRVYGDRIRLEPVALSDAAGSAELRFPPGHYPLATLEKSNDLHDLGAINVQQTELRTLDSYKFDEVGLVKIDVEGHEEAVIRGGFDTLRRNSPSLVIEIEERHNKGAISRVTEMLKALDYSGFFLADGMLHELDTFDLSRDQSLANVGSNGKTGRYINNFIFIPQRRLKAFKSAATKLLAN